MKIYLAARYSRRIELCRYRFQLHTLGHQVTSRWLDGAHQIGDAGQPIGDAGEALVEGDAGAADVQSAILRERFATEDVLDVQAADLLIAFTEPPRSGASRGGRHVELGLALGQKRTVWVVGPRENIFCWLPQVRHFPTWDECRQALRTEVIECGRDSVAEPRAVLLTVYGLDLTDLRQQLQDGRHKPARVEDWARTYGRRLIDAVDYLLREIDHLKERNRTPGVFAFGDATQELDPAN